MKKKKILTEVFVLLFIAAVFMAAYVVIEMGNDWLAVLGGAAVLLIAAYLLMDYRMECGQEEKESEAEQDVLSKRLDELEEVQKAIYTVMKRGNSENAEILQKMDEHMVMMTQVLEKLSEASLTGETAANATCRELLQTERKVLDAVKGLRQDYQTGVKNLIKYEKENAKQIAETTHNNTEMTIMELNTQFAKIQECLQAQSETLTAMPLASVNIPYSMPETAGEAFEPAEETDADDLLPVLEDAKPAEEAMPGIEDAEAGDLTEGDADDFDAEAAIKAYMIEQGYVDADDTQDPDDAESPVSEPIEAEPAPAQKSEEEIANTLQSMASGDPNRALTPEEIAAMFAAIQ